MILRWIGAALLLSSVAAAQGTAPAPAQLQYRLANGDRLVFRERIHREVSAKEASSIAEADWTTQVLVLTDTATGNYVIGTQRNRTRAELLQDRMGGKDRLAQGRADFEQRLRRRGGAFSEANMVNPQGAPLLPRVAAREWLSLVWSPWA